jgi:hypothetical protein
MESSEVTDFGNKMVETVFRLKEEKITGGGNYIMLRFVIFIFVDNC